jgi:hypothetical protein
MASEAGGERVGRWSSVNGRLGRAGGVAESISEWRTSQEEKGRGTRSAETVRDGSWDFTVFLSA